MTTNPKNAAAIYVRRSHKDAAGSDEDQRRGGKSLAQQEKECRALAKREGLTVVEVYAEREGTGASRYSKAKTRPEYERALADLDRGDRFRTLIVWELERFDRTGWASLEPLFRKHSESGDRRVIDMAGLDTSKPDQKWNVLIRAEMAAEEVAKLSRRVRRGKQGQRDSGVWLGGRAPYGLQVVGQKVQPDPDTSGTARRIAEMALRGDTFHAIARTLNAENIPGPSGGEWRASTLRTIVLSPAFAGVQSVRGTNAHGNPKTLADVYLNSDGEPVPIGTGIITLAERRKIEQQLAKRTTEHHGTTHDTVRGSRRVNSLLGKIARCALCDGRVIMGGAKVNPKYSCSNHAHGGSCRGWSILVRTADEAVDQLMRERFTEYELDSDFLTEIGEAWISHDDPQTQAEREDAQAELDDARAALERVEDAFADGLLDSDALKRQRPRLQKRIERAQQRAEKVAPKQIDLEWFDPEDLLTEWDSADTHRRQELLDFVMREILIGPAKMRGSKQGAKGRIRAIWKDGTQTAT